MARMFTGTDAIIFPSVAFKTMYDNNLSFWLWPTFAQNDGLDHYVCDAMMHFGYGRFSLIKLADGRLGGCVAYSGGQPVGFDTYITTYTLIQNAWNCISWPFGGSGGGKVFLNGQQIGTTGGGLNPGAGYSLTIGNNLSRTASISGAIGEFVISGRAWKAEQALAYYNSWNPDLLNVDPTSSWGTTHYMPLWGIHNPEPDMIAGRLPGTVFGTTRFHNPPTKPYSHRWALIANAYSEPFVPPDPEALGGPNAVLVIPDEGEVIAQQVLLGTAPSEDLWLRLFINDYYPNELSTRASFVEPDGYNYAPATLTKGVDWTFTPGTPTPSVATSWSRTFELTGPVGNVYGFWVEGKVSRKVYWAARYTTGAQYIGAIGGTVIIPPRISATSA